MQIVGGFSGWFGDVGRLEGGPSVFGLVGDFHQAHNDRVRRIVEGIHDKGFQLIVGFVGNFENFHVGTPKKPAIAGQDSGRAISGRCLYCPHWPTIQIAIHLHYCCYLPLSFKQKFPVPPVELR